MRFFPSASRQRLAAAAAAGALALGAMSVPSPQFSLAADDLKDQQKKVQKKIHGAAEDLEHSSAAARKALAKAEAARADLDRAKGRLSRVRVRLESARTRDERMAEKLQQAEERLEQARIDLEAGQEALAEQRRVVRDRVADSYMQGSPELATITSLLRTRSTEDLTRQQTATGAIMSRETGMYDDLEAAELVLQIRETEVQTAKQEVAVDRRKAAQHLEKIRRLTAQAVSRRDDVRDLAATRADARRAAFAAKLKDRKALNRLKKQEARIKQRILAAARASRGSSISAQPSGFLQRPVAGPVTSSFGYRTHPIYKYWGMHDGTDFGVACREPLKASGTGTVIAKYYSEVYGNRLYLSLGRVNGKSLTVVYNHAYGYRYDVGDRVARGAVVGTVGSTGWSTGCHLHFTVLVAGKAVDPMNWL